MELLIRLGLAALCFFAWSALAVDTGAEIAKKNAPRFYQDLTNQLGEAKANALLENWTLADVQEVSRYYEIFDRRQGPIRKLEESKSSLGGIIVETCGAADMRKRVSEVPGSVFLDETMFSDAAPSTSSPDGLWAIIDGDKIKILGLMEAKTVIRPSDLKRQLRKYLEVWRDEQRGLTVLVNGVKKTFAPVQISIEIGGQLKPIVDCSDQEIRSLTTVYSTTKDSLNKNFHWIGLEREELNQLVTRIIGRWSSTVAPDKPIVPIPSAIARTVDQIPPKTGEFEAAVFKNQAWPTKTAKDKTVSELAREIERQGGEAAFFLTLDPGMMQFLTDFIRPPEQGALWDAIVNADPNSHQVQSALINYTRHYDSKKDGAATVQKLCAQNARWASFFKQHPDFDPSQRRPEDNAACDFLIQKFYPN